jgi:hypothetical protein
MDFDNARETRGREIADRMRVVRVGDAWSVPSQSSAAKYRVDPDAPSCTCDDFGLRGPVLLCKHIYAVRFVIEREQRGDTTPPPEPAVEEAPSPRRPTYPQNWPAYVRAQTNERPRFLALLAELTQGIEEPARAKTGRKPVSLADSVFVAAYKVYETIAGRRFDPDFEAVHKAGHVSRKLHPHKISGLMGNPLLTPILYELIRESSAPLADFEEDFAADSTSFSTCTYVRWFDEKYGKERSEHVWLKVQVMTGVRTNIITSADIVADGPDGPHLPKLVRETAERFTVREVSADKGYSSVEAHEAVAAVGGTPFISFKRVATGGSGGLWQKSFHFFQLHREEFLAHYHKRSNAESTFSALKRKFGPYLRSRTKTAMKNELLCKLLCHNIVCLIHEQEELGVTSVFWGEEPPPPILKFPA